MVILIRCNDIVTDPRAMKYVKYIRDNKIPHRFIGWDRDMANPEIEDAILMQMPAGYNVGGMKAAWNRVKWMFFVYKQLCKMKVRNATLHGCDVDSAFPAACYKLFHPSNKLIFDVFDWFSDSLCNQNFLIRFVFKLIERFTVTHSDYIFICEEERIRQIPFYVKPGKIKVLPNIPYYDSQNFLRKDSTLSFDNDLITVSYVGGFVNDRFIKELITVAKEGIINLSIAGFGNQSIEDDLKETYDKYGNIRFYGRVGYNEGLNISFNSDVMYAMYCKTNPNHIFAAPNKYYEAMFLGKAIITTKGIIVEDKVLKNNSGYAIEESIEELRNLVNSLSKEDLISKGINAKKLWDVKYKNYVQRFFDEEYLELVR